MTDNLYDAFEDGTQPIDDDFMGLPTATVPSPVAVSIATAKPVAFVGKSNNNNKRAADGDDDDDNDDNTVPVNRPVAMDGKSDSKRMNTESNNNNGGKVLAAAATIAETKAPEAPKITARTGLMPVMPVSIGSSGGLAPQPPMVLPYPVTAIGKPPREIEMLNQICQVDDLVPEKPNEDAKFEEKRMKEPSYWLARQTAFNARWFERLLPHNVEVLSTKQRKEIGKAAALDKKRLKAAEKAKHKRGAANGGGSVADKEADDALNEALANRDALKDSKNTASDIDNVGHPIARMHIPAIPKFGAIHDGNFDEWVNFSDITVPYNGMNTLMTMFAIVKSSELGHGNLVSAGSRSQFPATSPDRAEVEIQFHMDDKPYQQIVDGGLYLPYVRRFRERMHAIDRHAVSRVLFNYASPHAKDVVDSMIAARAAIAKESYSSKFGFIRTMLKDGHITQTAYESKKATLDAELTADEKRPIKAIEILDEFMKSHGRPMIVPGDGVASQSFFKVVAPLYRNPRKEEQAYYLIRPRSQQEDPLIHETERLSGKCYSPPIIYYIGKKKDIERPPFASYELRPGMICACTFSLKFKHADAPHNTARLNPVLVGIVPYKMSVPIQHVAPEVKEEAFFGGGLDDADDIMTKELQDARAFAKQINDAAKLSGAEEIDDLTADEITKLMEESTNRNLERSKKIVEQLQKNNAEEKAKKAAESTPSATTTATATPASSSSPSASAAASSDGTTSGRKRGAAAVDGEQSASKRQR